MENSKLTETENSTSADMKPHKVGMDCYLSALAFLFSSSEVFDTSDPCVLDPVPNLQEDQSKLKRLSEQTDKWKFWSTR